jgi:hypothetical protein
MSSVRDNIKRFVWFIGERENIRLERQLHDAPWTNDPILAAYRFCNVQREHDKVTRWIRQNWTAEFATNPHHWFAMTVARLFNKPETLDQITDYVLPFRGADVADIVGELKAHGDTVFSAAYIVSTNGKRMDKVDYVVEEVLQPLWDHRGNYRPLAGQTLADFHLHLTRAKGMGSFMAAQVVADEKNNPESPLAEAKDWRTWAAPGPGSLRGLNRILGNGPVKTGFSDGYFLQELNKLQDIVNEKLGMGLCAQDIQNCLCEFDKYERARLGEGKPKQRYTP